MKRNFTILVFFILIPSLLMAQTIQRKRRVEEEKRKDLQPTEVQISEKEVKPPQPPFIDMIYLKDLVSKKVTFGYDACKVLVMLMRVEEQYIDLDSQIAFLKENNLLPRKIAAEFNPMQPLRKGVISYMFCKALKIKGGLILRLFGVSERYALKELVFEGIMFPGNTNDIVSGDELVAVFMQASNYMMEKVLEDSKTARE